MRFIARKTLVNVWNQAGCKDAEQPLRTWSHETRNARWDTPADRKRRYRKASILRNNRVAVNIGGNKYRLVVAVNDKAQIVFIRFIGSHGLVRKDLEPYFGSRGRVSEVLGRKRGMSLSMIRKLHRGLGIPAEVLLAEK